MNILGISAYYHDSAAALLRDDVLVAAAEEERFSRRKHDNGFPLHAVEYCLSQGGLGLESVDRVVFYEKPMVKLGRLLATYAAHAPVGFASYRAAGQAWLGGKLDHRTLIGRALRELDGSGRWNRRIDFVGHHESHAASAFFPSPFEAAAVLTVDGVGEWTTTMLADAEGTRISPLLEIRFPHSLGLLYSAFTQYLGFRVNSGEYKLMGLAPYGRATEVSRILDNLLDLRPDGSFALNMTYFDYCTGFRMINERFEALFGMATRRQDEPFLSRHLDIAASIQSALEEALLRIVGTLARETGRESLCMAGGVALNCVANARLKRDGPFRRIWVQPAAGDAGGAVGAAWLGRIGAGGSGPRHVAGRDGMGGGFLGPGFDMDEIENRLSGLGAVFRRLAPERLLDEVADTLAAGRVVAWFQGRMEFGPRALGARSILADPRVPGMRGRLNRVVKNREGFRPFAPAVRKEDAGAWFDLDGDSPYMLFTAPVTSRRRTSATGTAGVSALETGGAALSEIPAVTHVDLSARVQTVDATDNPLFHALLGRFAERTGCPVLVNTSFNVRGEPIVCSPEDAFRCFLGAEIDLLVCGDALLDRAEQSIASRASGSRIFEPD